MAGRWSAAGSLFGLVLARLRSGVARWVPVSLMMAAAVALLACLAAISTLSADDAARGQLRRLSPEQRAVRATWISGLPAGVAGRAEALVRGITAAAPTRSLALQPARIDAGAPVRLVAISPLARWVRLTSGRLPTGCRAGRCELLQLDDGPAARAQVSGRGVHLVVVGRGTLRSALPLGFVPRAARESPPVLAAGDPGALEALTGLDGVARIHSWMAQLPVSGLRAWQLDATAARVSRAVTAAEREDDGLTVTAPVDQLRSAAARAALAPGRVAVAGGVAATGLVALVLLAALGLRQSLGAEIGRLRRRGASRGQRGAVAFGECALPTAIGVAAGIGAAVGAVAVITAAWPGGEGAGGVAVVLDRLTSPPGRAVVWLVGVWGAGTGLALMGARLSVHGARRLADGLLVAGIAAVAGLSGTGRLGVGEAGPLWLVPVLAGLAGALLAARLTPVVLRGASKLRGARGPGGSASALVWAARRPGPPALTIAALCAVLGLILFAGAFRATLRDGQAQFASFRVPFAATVAPGADLTSPLDRAALARWASVPGVSMVAPVLRTDAEAAQGPDVQPVTLLALPAGALGQLDQPGLSKRAGRLPSPGPPPSGPRLGAAGSTVSVRARSQGDALDVALLVRDAADRLRSVPLGTAGESTRTLRARVPRALGGGRIFGFSLMKPSGEIATAGHQAAEGAASVPDPGATFVLGPLRGSRGQIVARYSGWRALAGADGQPTRAGFRTRVRFDRAGRGLLTTPSAGADTPLPVLTDPQTATDAGPARRVGLRANGASFTGTIVGTAARMPTVTTDRFVVADLDAARQAIERTEPGAALPRELWIGARPGTDTAALRGELLRVGNLAAPAAPRLSVRTQTEERKQLEAEPLASGLLRALGVAEGVLAALTIFGLIVAVGRLERDGAATWAELEADGVPPRRLRRVLAGSGLLTTVLGAAAGVALGAVLLSMVVSLTGQVSAVAPGTDLHPSLPVLSTLVLFAAVTAAAAAVVLLKAGRVFRGAWPARPLGGEAE